MSRRKLVRLRRYWNRMRRVNRGYTPVISRAFSAATTRRIAAMAPARLAKQRGSWRASQYDVRSYPRSEVV